MIILFHFIPELYNNIFKIMVARIGTKIKNVSYQKREIYINN